MIVLEEIQAELRARCTDVRVDEPLASHVAFRIGGPADLLVVPADAEELRAVVSYLFDRHLAFTVLGRGSNVLIADRGIRGIVLKIGRGVDRVTFDGARVVAEAGAYLPHLAALAAARGLSGLEFSAGIPAALGGAVVMNAGAHGHSMSEIVARVRVLGPEGEREIPGADLGFAYRTSALQAGPAVVLQAELHLRPEDPRTVRERMEAWLRERNQTQPIGPPSSGCIFRNPPGDHAGRLIDQAGCKGLRVGGACVSEIHANYIVNDGAASAGDVMALAARVRQRVEAQFGVALALEVKLLGEFDE